MLLAIQHFVVAITKQLKMLQSWDLRYPLARNCLTSTRFLVGCKWTLSNIPPCFLQTEPPVHSSIYRLYFCCIVEEHGSSPPAASEVPVRATDHVIIHSCNTPDMYDLNNFLTKHINFSGENKGVEVYVWWVCFWRQVWSEDDIIKY